ncbi:hypothetical protein HYW39_00550 [Candidatus Curtissbacteria bacterium]|nr:hypothetical protein [Candidatus Curtissbacteria bacterium]
MIAIVILGIWRLLKTKKDKNLFILFKINLILIIVSFLIFAVFITVEVKNWYLWGLTAPMALLIIFSLFPLRKYKLLIMLFLVSYLFINVIPFFRNERIVKTKLDPAQLSNQLTVLSIIYNDSQNDPFSVFVYTPVIYDLNWQYLSWWQGIKEGRGLPTDFAYLPNQPDYVRNKNVYAPKPRTSPLVYLVIERGQENQFYARENWLKNFEESQIVWEKNVNDAIILQKRIR